MSCPQCFSGHVNPGTPLGRIETVYGRRTYIAEPPEGKPPKGVVVIVPDAFGLPFVNNKILADHYASLGQYLVYIPDFMDGTQASVNTMINMAHLFDEKTSWLWKPYYLVAAALDLGPFLIRNRPGVAWPKITSFLKALREDKGPEVPVGVAGFCWGGLYAIKLAHNVADARTSSGQPLADAFFAAHASNVTVPQDIEHVTLNLSFAIGDDDAVMNMKQVRQVQEVLKGKEGVDSEVVVYPGAKHGFAVRGSRAQPDSQETKQAEEAENQAIVWFQRQFEQVKRGTSS